MKAILLLLILFNFSLLIADDYILEFQANVKIIKEYNIVTNKTGTSPMGKEVIEYFISTQKK